MNYFNHQNVQLAYEAVYNQDLCESMEDLGLIDDYDYLDEERKADKVARQQGSPRSSDEKREQRNTETRLPTSTREDLHKGRRNPHGRLGSYYHDLRMKLALGKYIDREGNPQFRGHYSRHPHAYDQDLRKYNRYLNRDESTPFGESYDLYDVILEYLIQEGYADTLGSAEIILENMSEDWIEEILEASVVSQQKGVAGRVQVRPVQQGGFGIGKIRVGATTVNRPVPGTFRAGGVSSRDAARYNTRIDNPDISAAERQSQLKRSGHSGFIPVRNPSSIPDTGIPGRPSPGRAEDQTRARTLGY